MSILTKLKEFFSKKKKKKQRVAHNKGKTLYRFKDGTSCFAFTQEEANKIHNQRKNK